MTSVLRGVCVALLAVAVAVTPQTSAAAAVRPTLDPTYASNGIAGLSYSGDPVVTFDGGTATLSQTHSAAFRIQRMDARGQLVSSFGTNGVLDVEVTNMRGVGGLVALPDGSFIVTFGIIDDVRINDSFLALRHYRANGSLDASFGTQGTVTHKVLNNNFIRKTIRQTDGKVVVTGQAFDLNPPPGTPSIRSTYITRFLTNGALDASFGNNGTVLMTEGPEFFTLVSGAEGKLLAGGTGSIDGGMGVLRLLGNGRPDPSFGVNGYVEEQVGGIGATVWDLRERSDRSVLVVGSLSDVDANEHIYNDGFVARLLPNGDFDLDFGFIGVTPVGPGDVSSNAYAFLQDGERITVGGSRINTPGQNSAPFVASMSSCGAPDISLSDEGFVDLDDFQYINRMLPEATGRFLVEGSPKTGGAAIGRYLLPSGLSATPCVPSNVTTTSLPAGLQINWQPPAATGGNAITRYLVTNADGDVIAVLPANQRSFTVNGLESGEAYLFFVSAENSVGESFPALALGFAGALPQAPLETVSNPTPSAATPTGKGYWMFSAGGEAFAFGDAKPLGSITGPLNRPIVDGVSTPDGKGYWMVASDGGVFAFGTAAFYGSTGSLRLNKPIVGMASTPSGRGYWLVASDGGIFSFGDAAFWGSTGSLSLNKPIVGMAGTPTGRGYSLVASDGGIFTFGDAAFYGSTGALKLNKPIVGMAMTPSGHGYWLTASDGGIFTFGDAGFFGSTGSLRLVSPIASAASTPSGKGYWLFAQDGGVFTFGDAGFFGSAGGSTRPASIT